MRKKRLELNLTQSEAAAAMGVDEMTVVRWELNRHAVSVGKMPALICFLGYVPEDLFPCNTLGQKIKRYRLLHGVSLKQIAKQLQIDAYTLRRLENGKGKFFPATLKRLASFLQSLD